MTKPKRKSNDHKKKRLYAFIQRFPMFAFGGTDHRQGVTIVYYLHPALGTKPYFATKNTFDSGCFCGDVDLEVRHDDGSVTVATRVEFDRKMEETPELRRSLEALDEKEFASLDEAATWLLLHGLLPTE